MTVLVRRALGANNRFDTPSSHIYIVDKLLTWNSLSRVKVQFPNLKLINDSRMILMALTSERISPSLDHLQDLQDLQDFENNL